MAGNYIVSHSKLVIQIKRKSWKICRMLSTCSLRSPGAPTEETTRSTSPRENTGSGVAGGLKRWGARSLPHDKMDRWFFLCRFTCFQWQSCWLFDFTLLTPHKVSALCLKMWEKMKNYKVTLQTPLRLTKLNIQHDWLIGAEHDAKR